MQSGYSIRGISSNVGDESDVFIDAANSGELVRDFNLLRSSRQRGLRLAARRIGYAANREDDEDVVLDCMIALEALLLKDVQEDRGELKFRAAVRAAQWAASLGGEASRVFDIVRRAYDFRSTIAHGGNIDRKKTVSVEGEKLLFRDVVNETRALAAFLTCAGLKMFADLGEASPNWDALLRNQINSVAHNTRNNCSANEE